MTQHWPVRLFNKSVLKQNKYAAITRHLGTTDGLHCLDVGADNGVISYLLRQRGGRWASADLDEQSVAAIRALVESEVYRLDGKGMPFADDEFDRVVIVDFLEHIEDDAGFVEELARIIKPGGLLIVNVPHATDGLIRRLRLLLGQTDEQHGHVRPGYTRTSLARLLNGRFHVEACHSYSGFFAELIDTLIVFIVSRLKGDAGADSKKGLLVTGADLRRYRLMFRVFSLLYPIIWLFAKLDDLLFFVDGHMLIVRARRKSAWG